jgi:Predicted periplasmic or secreted lipoprotein
MVLKERRFYGLRPDDAVLHPYAASLEARVAAALADSAEVDAADVTVTADGSQITLSGRVSREEEIGRCSQIALRIDGVVTVRNLIGLWADAPQGAIPPDEKGTP